MSVVVSLGASQSQEWKEKSGREDLVQTKSESKESDISQIVGNITRGEARQIRRKGEV